MTSFYISAYRLTVGLGTRFDTVEYSGVHMRANARRVFSSNGLFTEQQLLMPSITSSFETSFICVEVWWDLLMFSLTRFMLLYSLAYKQLAQVEGL
jgi:hypothetical protein